MVALFLYLFFACVIEFGRLFFGANAVQGVADLAAREFSRAPLPPAYLEDGETPVSLAYYLGQTANSSDPGVAYVQQNIYDPNLLVIDVTDWVGSGSQERLYDFVLAKVQSQLGHTMPAVNMALMPLMFVDPIERRVHHHGEPVKTIERMVLRYPGRLVPAGHDNGVNHGLTVEVVTLNPDDGGELSSAISQVIEEIPYTTSPFAVTSPQAGLVALRVNYPFQAATMAAYPPTTPGADKVPHVIDPITVPGQHHHEHHGHDHWHNEEAIGPYTGDGGGQLYAVGQTVRPFQRLITAQALYRREIFGAATTTSNPGPLQPQPVGITPAGSSGS